MGVAGGGMGPRTGATAVALAALCFFVALAAALYDGVPVAAAAAAATPAEHSGTAGQAFPLSADQQQQQAPSHRPSAIPQDVACTEMQRFAEYATFPEPEGPVTWAEDGPQHCHVSFSSGAAASGAPSPGERAHGRAGCTNKRT